MATWYLINSVGSNVIKHLPGALIDDAKEDATFIRAAGGLLWPSTDTLVAAAASVAQAARRNRGASEEELAEIMTSAIEKSQMSAGGITEVTNVAGLLVPPNPAAPTLAQVATNLGYYIYDPASTLTADGRNIIAPSSSAGRWIRMRWGHEAWRGQAAWFIDSTSGNDEATGVDASNPIKTVKELAYRLGGRATRPVIITLVQTGTHPTTDPFDQLTLTCEWDQTLSGSQPYVQITGTPTVVLTSTVTTAAIPVGASNLASQIQDTTVSSWTTHAGRMVHVLSGASAGAYAWVLKDIGSNTARLTRWSSINGASVAAPAPGDSYEILTIGTTLPAQMPTVLGGTNNATTIQLCTVIGASPYKLGSLTLIGCKTGGLSGVGRINLIVSLITTACTFTGSDGYLSVSNSGSLGVFALSFNLGASFITSEFVAQQSQLSVANGANVNLVNYSAFDCAVSSSGVVFVTNLGQAVVTGNYYGSGNAFATLIQRGGKVALISATPTMAGTVELSFESSSTVIPYPSVGGMVPNAATMTTWAQFAAAPFNSYVCGPTGSCIYTSGIARTPVLGLQSVGMLVVADLAALKAITSNTATFLIAKMTSNLSYWVYEPASTYAADDIGIVAPTAGAGKWLRFHWGQEDWRKQSTWFIDATNGSDAATGTTSGAPLKTIRELAYRLGGVYNRGTSITFLTDHPTTDPLSQLSMRCEWNRVSTGNASCVLTLIGTQTTTRTGTVNTASVPVPASNLASTVNDSGVSDWTSDVGNLLVMTSGAANGAMAWVMKDLTGGSARLSRWYNSGFTAVSAAPANGDTYKIVTQTSIAESSLPNLSTSPNGAFSNGLIVRNLTFPLNMIPSMETGFSTIFQGCKLAGITTANRKVQADACLFNGIVNHIEGGFFKTSSCASLSVAVNIQTGAKASFTDFLVQAGAGFQVNTGSYASLVSQLIFDTTTAGLDIQNGSVECSTTLAGSGNAIATRVKSGGVLRLNAGFTPTLAGTTELQLESVTTAIPPLTASASVPAASALTTWANWAASPFSKFVRNYSTGSGIFGN